MSFNTESNISTNIPLQLSIIKNSVFDSCNLAIINFSKDAESKEYSACTFTLNNLKIVYRDSKITPTKNGNFVTIWKKNAKGITQPFDMADDLDFIIVTCKNENNFGFFIFSKNSLVQQKIITANGIEGKRGIRVYPPWVLVNSKQADKTQKWQTNYFVEMNTNAIKVNDKTKNLLQKKF